jgi:excisionase family DNA binding protein
MNNSDLSDSHEALDFVAEGSVNVNAANGKRQPQMQLLSLKEVKDTLGIGDWMMYELLRTNAIRSVKIGKRRLISVRALEEYVVKLEAESEANGNYGY